jgi:hypothetical protein
MENEQQLLSLPAVAKALRLPVKWIKGEAEAGRLPCLRAGRRLLFARAAVEAALVSRAAAGKAVPDGR